MRNRSGVIILLVTILAATGCSQDKNSNGPQSLQNLPYRPLKTLIPAEDTWYNPKHTDVINPRNQLTSQSTQEKIAGKEHWGHMVHRLQRGDSLYSLARRYYGDAGHWRLILAANRKELPNAHQLPLSTFIYLPMLPLKNPDGSVRTPGRRPEYYIIGAGDTLAKVARIFLGKTEYYKLLAQFNNLPDPDQVNAGQLITLPKDN
jgi:nucleoid-associated protein YgaU